MLGFVVYKMNECFVCLLLFFSLFAYFKICNTIYARCFYVYYESKLRGVDVINNFVMV